MPNYYATELNNRITSRFVRDSSDMTMVDWVVQNTTLNGRPFSTKRYPFQDAILNDLHPNMDVIKCSQVGLTEVQIRKILGWVHRNRGVSAIFTLPEEKLFKRVAQTRVKPILQADRVFSLGEQEQVRSMGIIQLGNSFLYITACTEGDATSTSADAVFNDEVDLSNQNMLALFNSRLQDSDYKINQRFSTPTFPMFGIDQGYQSSDKHQYLARCEACNHWNNPRFNRNFVDFPGLPDHIEEFTDIEAPDLDHMDLINASVVCEKCRSPLDLSNSDLRCWVAEHPNRTQARGYRVSPFSTHRLPPSYILDQMLKYKGRQFIRGWHNTVLGEPHTDGNIQLSDEAIAAAMKSPKVPEVGADTPVSIGVDMGQVCHIVVGAMDGYTIFLFKSVSVDDLPDEIASLEKRFNIVTGGIDRHPYTPTSNAIRDNSEGRIMPIEYAPAGPDFVINTDPITGETNYLRANRTALIDRVAGSVREGRAHFHGYSHQKQVITEHLKDMYRDAQPEKPAKWVKLTGKDHYFHAMAFYRAGIEGRNFVEAMDKSENRSNFGFQICAFGEGESKSFFGSTSSSRHIPPEQLP